MLFKSEHRHLYFAILLIAMTIHSTTAAQATCLLDGVSYGPGSNTCACPTIEGGNSKYKISQKRLECTGDGNWIQSDAGDCTAIEIQVDDTTLLRVYAMIQQSACGASQSPDLK